MDGGALRSIRLIENAYIPLSDGVRIAAKIWLPEDAFAAAFAQNASDGDRAVLAAVQRPISVNCITVPVGRPLWKDIPSWFLVAEADRGRYEFAGALKRGRGGLGRVWT